MDLDITPLFEAVIGLAVPFVLYLAHRHLGITASKNDAELLEKVMRRGAELAVKRLGAKTKGPVSAPARGPELAATVHDYAVRNSPDLVARVTRKQPAKLAERAEAEVATIIRGLVP